MPDRSSPDRSSSTWEGSIWKAERIFSVSTVNSEDRSISLADAPEASSAKVRPVRTSTSGRAIWSWTTAEAAAWSMTWRVSPGV